MIISSVQKQGQRLNLSSLKVDIEDASYLSNYFVLTEYEPKFSSGKNTFLLNGSDQLAPSSAVQIEVIDSKNNSLYVEVAKSNSIGYTQGGALRIAVYVYDTTPFGVGKIIIVGKTKDNRTVRWTGNIQIDPLAPNVSSVVFYRPPKLTVVPQTVVAGNQNNQSPTILQNISGSMKTTSVIPRKGSDYNLFNNVFQNVDYRLQFQSNGGFKPFSSASMQGNDITLYINTISFSDGTISSTNLTSSNVIEEVLNDDTIKLKSPIYVINKRNEKELVDVIDGSFSSSITTVQYNSTPTPLCSQSLAIIEYTNIETFCGNVYRYKVYRKSLSSAGDYELISDAPISSNEELKDDITSNSYFSSLGTFPYESHLQHYWQTSSNGILLTRDGSALLDSMKISGSINEQYIIVKNDTELSQPIPRSKYINYDQNSITNQSGSSFDSNFMHFFSDIQYELSFKSIVTKIDPLLDASVSFYITSSMIDNIGGDINFDSQRGLKLGEITLGSETSSLYQIDEPNVFYNKFSNEFYGTMVIYVKNCVATLNKISMKTYAELSFSPSIYYNTILFPISVKGEQFQFKSELFDINHRLVYSNLFAIASFDPNGSTISTATVAEGRPGSSSTDITVTAAGIDTITSAPVTVTVTTSWPSGFPLKQPDVWLDIIGYKVPAYKP